MLADTQDLYLSLAWKPSTSEARSLCNEVLSQVQRHWQRNGTGKQPIPGAIGTQAAVGGFCGDLMAALAAYPRRRLVRLWSPKSFNAEASTGVPGTGYRAAAAVREALMKLNGS